ncbi:DUF397 domain-containing protein [Streptomyces sp. NPDC002536]
MRTVCWQKSSFSGPDDNQECVELADAAGVVMVRESDVPGVVARVEPAGLRALICSVKAGRLDQLG